MTQPINTSSSSLVFRPWIDTSFLSRLILEGSIDELKMTLSDPNALHSDYSDLISQTIDHIDLERIDAQTGDKIINLLLKHGAYVPNHPTKACSLMFKAAISDLRNSTLKRLFATIHP